MRSVNNDNGRETKANGTLSHEKGEEYAFKENVRESHNSQKWFL